MRTESASAPFMTIFDADGLDPICVVTHDYGGGAGRLIVTCYGEAWAMYWGAMGDRRVREFVLACSPSYVADKLSRHKQTKALDAYLLRIVVAVQNAWRLPLPADPCRGDCRQGGGCPFVPVCNE